MIQRNRNDAILVKFITFNDGKEKYISSYYTTAIDQTLKMFITAKDYEIECWFNEHSEVVAKEYIDYPGYIVQDVYLKLGSSDDMPVIEVII